MSETSNHPRRKLVLCGGGSPTFDAMWARYEALTGEERALFHDGTVDERVRISTLIMGDVWGGERINLDGTRDLVCFPDPGFNEALRNLYDVMAEGQSRTAALAVVPLVPVRDPVRDFLSIVRTLRPNGVVDPRRREVRAEDFADAFAFVERYDLPVSTVLVHPDDWYGRHESVDSSTTHVVDIDGCQVGRLWTAKVFAHESIPVGTLYVVGAKGVYRENVRGESEGLSTIVLRG